MRINQLENAIRHAWDCGLVPLVWGTFGIGKTSIVEEVSREYGTLCVKELATCDAVDLRGIPQIINGRTTWSYPSDLPHPSDGDRFVLFLDDITTMEKSLAPSLFRMMTHREIAGVPMGKDWKIILAGNGKNDGSVFRDLPKPLKTRLVHLYVEPSATSTADYGEAQGWDSAITGLLRWQPDLVHVVNMTDNWEDGDALPCPRTWEMVNKSLAFGVNENVIMGLVGQNAGQAFITFRKMADELPNPEMVLAAPNSCSIPDGGALYALCAMLQESVTSTNFGKLVEFTERLPVEFRMFTVQGAVRRNPKLCLFDGAPHYQMWVAKYQHLL